MTLVDDASFDDVDEAGSGPALLEGAPARSTLVAAIVDLLGDGAEWRARAACRGADVDVFFPTRGGDVGPALAFCRRCPVAAECADYALDNGERFGVWGGLAARNRRGGRRPEAA